LRRTEPRPPDETDTGQNFVHASRALGRGLAAAAEGEHAYERGERQARRDRVDELGLDREQDAPQGRACDMGQLESDGALCKRADQDLLGHERWRERATCGRPESAGNPGEEGEGEERPYVVSTCTGDPEERERDQHVDADHEHVDAPARNAVCEVARGQCKQEKRQKLREPDQPEVERVLPHRVHLPADGDSRHLHREARGEEGDPEEAKVAVPKR
jgi:hypothetical protein